MTAVIVDPGGGESHGHSGDRPGAVVLSPGRHDEMAGRNSSCRPRGVGGVHHAP